MKQKLSLLLTTALAALTLGLAGCGHGHHKDCGSKEGATCKMENKDCGSCKDCGDCKDKSKCKDGDKCPMKDEKKDAAKGAHNETVTTGAFANVDYKTRSNTYFAGNLNEAAIAAAKTEGVTTVINLLSTPEDKAQKFNEKATVEKTGMTYYHIPVATSGETFDTKTLAEIESAYMTHHKKGEKVIVHCASGGRASAWFAYHLNKTHGDTVENAITGARELGLQGKVEEKIKKTLVK